MKKSTLSVCSALAITAALSYAGPAHASMDYGSLQALFGEPVTTAATGTPQKASEVATDMTIITADEIRQSGSRNIPGILSRVPGLDILQESINSWDVGVRGYQQPYNPRLLVLIDGRQVFIDDYSRMDWGNLPINVDDIRQIEVVKGASSALFGSNATGGVINIITYSPLYDKSNVASVSLGTQNELTGDATVTVPLTALDGTNFGGVKVSAGGINENEFPAGGGTGTYTTPYHHYVAQSSVIKVNNNLEFNTQANYSDKDDNEGDFLYAVAPVKTASYSAGGGFDWQTPYGLIKSNNYINHYFKSIDALGLVTDSPTLVVSELEDQFKIGSNDTFRAMMEYRYKESHSVNTPTEHPENANLNENSYAVGGTWLHQFNDKLSWTNALRGDHQSMFMDGTLLPRSPESYGAYNQAYNTLSVNSGLVYKATDLDSFRATYGRGVQDPSLIQSGWNTNLEAVPGVVNLDYVGNPNLKPTIVDNYELGYDRKIPKLLSTARFSTYYEFNHDLTSALALGPDAYGAVEYQNVNVGNSQGYGGEIELKGSHPSGFRWDGSYSYQTIRDADLVATTLGYSRSAPEHHLRLLLGYTTGKWEFDANGQYVTSTDMLRTLVQGGVTTQDYTSGYASVSGRIGYQINDHVTAAATAVNIQQQNLQASAYPDVQRQFLLTLTDKF